MFEHIWCEDNMGHEKDGAFVEKITAVVPSERQYAHMKRKYYNFIHFGMNTVTGMEWGDGTVPPSTFNPQQLDTDQWCEVLKRTGSTGIILTAKHHDGFCLWDTKTTDYNVMNSPFGKDIVKMLSESCQKYGLDLGIYISPWDRHEPTYGSEAYNDFYVRQLTELATNYGEIFTFWFDGACGEGPNGKKQRYDFPRYYAVLRELQPNACLAICGPDIRWIGNEGGHVRESEWSVVPAPVVSAEEVADKSQKTNDGGAAIQQISSEQQDLGSRDFLRNFDSFRFSPAECDVSVNLAWFWHDDDYYKGKKQRTSEDIARIYMNTVGGNALLLLNVPPNDQGLIGQREIALLAGFKAIIDKKFAKPVTPLRAEILSTDGALRPAPGLLTDAGEAFGDTDHAVVLTLPEGQQVSLLTAEEELRHSQRVERFELYSQSAEKTERLYEGTVIGSGKFCEFPARSSKLILNIMQSRGAPHLKNIQLYE